MADEVKFTPDEEPSMENFNRKFAELVALGNKIAANAAAANLSNVSDEDFAAKAEAAGVGGGTGGAVESVNGFTGAVRLFTYGTEDLTAGVSELPTGTLYFVYE